MKPDVQLSLLCLVVMVVFASYSCCVQLIACRIKWCCALASCTHS